jgi:hypothetical protein
MRGLFGFSIGFLDKFSELVSELVADPFTEKVLHSFIGSKPRRVLFFDRRCFFPLGIV